jgi:SAM-dependent methyltransferase
LNKKRGSFRFGHGFDPDMSFDSIAPHYRWMEFLLAGDKLQRCRTAFLSRIENAQNVLILGEGNGRFLVECRKTLRSARITCIDASARMLQLAGARLARAGLNPEGIAFVRADALAWAPPPRCFDLIVTHFFLDCFRGDQLERLVASLGAGAQADAAWLLADFQIPERGRGRLRAQIIHRMMYAFFRLTTRLPARRWTAPDPFLESHGFVLEKRLSSDWDLLRSDLWRRPETGRRPELQPFSMRPSPAY